VKEYFAQGAHSYEVVVVDDGSADDTAERARASGIAELSVLVNEPNRGKGYSVRRGMLAARGAHRLMTDADLSTPIEELDRLLAVQREGADVVIGSRAVAGSNIEVRQPWYRENMGRLFNVLVRILAVPGVHDTQCGFKLFTARAADEVFGRARLDGFSFDVEALYLARRAGFRIAELPVTWRNDAATRVGMLGGFLAFPDLFRIRANAWLGRYRP
jgi:dolichyl-phosphate beta-glucosyltransferase